MLGQAALVDDMYDMLAAYEQKVPMTDQVRCRAMGEGCMGGRAARRM